MPSAPQTIDDPEFGKIKIIRKSTKYVRIKLGTKGQFIVTCNRLIPIAFIRSFIQKSREDMRKMAMHSSIMRPYVNNQKIDRYRTLAVVPTQMVSKPMISCIRDKIIVKIPPGFSIDDPSVQDVIRNYIVKILRKDAKKYLTVELQKLADEYGFTYERVRFSHASSRWGSCSSTGTISLNIALMKLPDDLIYYVLIHELCHTKHMNHSQAFWHEVEKYDPHFRSHRQRIKNESPVV